MTGWHCPGCSHRKHQAGECHVVPRFTRETRCACTYELGEPPSKEDLAGASMSTSARRARASEGRS